MCVCICVCVPARPGRGAQTTLAFPARQRFAVVRVGGNSGQMAVQTRQYEEAAADDAEGEFRVGGD